jgi:hypothetical protein
MVGTICPKPYRAWDNLEAVLVEEKAGVQMRHIPRLLIEAIFQLWEVNEPLLNTHHSNTRPCSDWNDAILE